MEILEVPLNDLVLDPNLNLRDRLDDFTVERYADSWQRLPPIVVWDVDGRLLVADGFHRHAAAVMLGKRGIKAEVMHGSFTEALDFVASVNLFHGLPLTRAERRRAVEVKLKLHHDWSDRRMAEELAVSRELVAKIRRQLIEGNQIPNNPGRVGSDGKMYSSAGLPKDPNERLPKQAEREDPRDHGRREADSAPWDGPAASPPTGRATPAAARAVPPWEADAEAEARRVALEPIPQAAPSIDEMLSVMTKQIMEMITWTHAEGFNDAYRAAGANARGLFQTAVIKLAARADQLRKS